MQSTVYSILQTVAMEHVCYLALFTYMANKSFFTLHARSRHVLGV